MLGEGEAAKASLLPPEVAESNPADPTTFGGDRERITGRPGRGSGTS